jgi:hypothetical protein
MLNVAEKSTAAANVSAIPDPSQLLQEEAAHWPTIFNSQLLNDVKQLLKQDQSGQTAYLIEKILHEGAHTMIHARGVDPFAKAHALDIWSKLEAQRQTLVDEYVAAFSNE